jgi:hypothetical protein
MDRKQARRILGILILLISLIILIWGLWPFAVQVRSLPVSPTEMQLPAPGSLIPNVGWGMLAVRLFGGSYV